MSAHPPSVRGLSEIRLGFTPYQEQFVLLPNQFARDARLSRAARGLLAELLSHQSGWRTSIAALTEEGREGRDAIRRMVSELETYGYLIRQQENIGGRFGVSTWTLIDPFANPQTQDTHPDVSAGHTDDGFSDDGNSDTDDGFSDDGNSDNGHRSVFAGHTDDGFSDDGKTDDGKTVGGKPVERNSSPYIRKPIRKKPSSENQQSSALRASGSDAAAPPAEPPTPPTEP